MIKIAIHESKYRVTQEDINGFNARVHIERTRLGLGPAQGAQDRHGDSGYQQEGPEARDKSGIQWVSVE